MDTVISLLSQLDYHTYWGVFIFGILISTTAMSSGIDGAVFWAPVLLIVYRVEPSVAIACAIFIEIFGFGSGIYGYVKRKKIKYREALYLLMFTIPMGMLGAYVSKLLPEKFLIFLISLSCLFLIVVNVKRAKMHVEVRKPDDLSLRNMKLGAILSMIGGFFVGTIGIGIGETNHYYLLIRNKYPTTFAVGTSVFMIAITAFFCSLFNLFYFAGSSSFDLVKTASILVFAIPSVIFGARIGVRIAHIIERQHFNYMLAGIFCFMCVISFYRILI
ncbi:sulfite exporter TauE/SafE family protein [Patescibacteria group bacterium]|nr:sulfite exporter TauE/SafE family protein [Patescibacteria group bacterium]MBU1702829.1 sulfite exporter TauE/SafE family protein [Patescibacteria group bacterium]MBU1954283.1 sulfite exporter TauE/SafE family protein [Patescibacteria group bacterium]